MVARRPFERRSPTLSSTRLATRATIKALPTPPNRPRPYGYLGLLPPSLPSVDAYWRAFMVARGVEVGPCSPKMEAR